METDSFSVPIKGHYETHDIFHEKAVNFIRDKVAEHTGIPPSDLVSEFTGGWHPITKSESLTKEYTGEVSFNRVLDPELGYEWDARIEITAIGENDDLPCEQFVGQVQLVVFE